jgi:pre-mRNA-splicing factor ISY1
MGQSDLLKKKIKVAKNKFDVFRQEEQVALGMIRQSGKRPLIATGTWTLQEAERWRTDVVKEIVGRVERIVDPLLQDHKIRDLNDLINRLFKEKKMWEARIKELGGPDYTRNVTNDMHMGGVSVPGTKGYRYFGRAKYLDGVKELFEQAGIIFDLI